MIDGSIPRPDKMHPGTVAMQDRFGTLAQGARVAKTVQAELGARDVELVRAQEWFFWATADETARVDCSFRSGPRGFVQVLDTRTLAFEDYDGNGSFMSLGNLAVNPAVALLFVDFEHAKRLRVGGRAEVLAGPAAEAVIAGARRVVRIEVTHVHANCPRHVPYLVKGVVPVTLVARLQCWVRARLGESPWVRRVYDWLQERL